MWPFKKRKRSSIEEFSKDSFDSAMEFEAVVGEAGSRKDLEQRALMDELVARLSDDLKAGGKFAREFEALYGLKKR